MKIPPLFTSIFPDIKCDINDKAERGDLKKEKSINTPRKSHQDLKSSNQFKSNLIGVRDRTKLGAAVASLHCEQSASNHCDNICSDYI